MRIRLQPLAPGSYPSSGGPQLRAHHCGRDLRLLCKILMMLSFDNDKIDYLLTLFEGVSRSRVPSAGFTHGTSPDPYLRWTHQEVCIDHHKVQLFYF